jgi:transposase-like protein
MRVDSLWGNIAYPPGDQGLDAQGRRRAVKRTAQRVVLSALGLWDDGHWESVHWQMARSADQATWPHCLGGLYRQGLTAETTTLIVREGRKGRASALASHVYGVPPQRCIFHKSKNRADPLVGEEAAVETAYEADTAARQARQARQQAILADARAG